MVLDVAAFSEIAPFVVTVVTSRGKVDKSWRTSKNIGAVGSVCDV